MQNQHLKSFKTKLNYKHKILMEQAYNFRQTDSALSDYCEYKAIKVLNKLIESFYET